MISKEDSNSINFNSAIKSNIFNIKDEPIFFLDTWPNHIKKRILNLFQLHMTK